MISISNYENSSTMALFPIDFPVVKQDITGNYEVTLEVSRDDNPFSFHLVQIESTITIGEQQFRIKQLSNKSNNKIKSFLAQHVFFDNVWRRNNNVVNGSKTLEDLADFAFSGKGISYTVDGTITESVIVQNFGNTNVIKMINDICDNFGCNYVITSANSVVFFRSNNGDRGIVFRYSDNIVALNENIDTSNLRTQIVAFGKDGMEVWYNSPNVDRWGSRDADPITDERYTDPDALRAKAKRALSDKPMVTLELDTVELLNLILGENVWLIYEEMDFDVQTKVIGTTKLYDYNADNFITTSVEIGNSLARTLTDQILEIQNGVQENSQNATFLSNRTTDNEEMLMTSRGEIANLQSDSFEGDNKRYYESDRNAASEQRIMFLESKVSELEQLIYSLRG